MVLKELIVELGEILAKIPVVWDGRKAVLEMREAEYAHWKQMEWIGFYFQFLCDAKLSPLLKIPGPTYGKVEFDGFSEIPWDFKAHPNKNSNGKENKSVIVNDKLATAAAIRQFGSTGLIIAIGDATYDDGNRSFQIWHQNLKGGLSNYEKERILRKAHSRLRKTVFRLKEIRIIILDDKTVQGLGSFQKGFRNSDGSPRKPKVLLNIENISAEKIIRFK